MKAQIDRRQDRGGLQITGGDIADIYSKTERQNDLMAPAAELGRVDNSSR